MQQEITTRELYDMMVKKFAQMDERMDKQEITTRNLYDFTVKRFSQMDERFDKIEDDLVEAKSLLRDHSNMFLKQNMAIYEVGHQVLEVSAGLNEVKIELARHGQKLDAIEANGTFFRAKFFKTMAVVTAAISLAISGTFNLAFSRS